MVVYKRADASKNLHTIWLQDGSRLDVHQAHIKLLEQPDFSNIPRTPLDYRNEVGTGLSLQEAQTLVTPQVLSPLQQEAARAYQRQGRARRPGGNSTHTDLILTRTSSTFSTKLIVCIQHWLNEASNQ